MFQQQFESNEVAAILTPEKWIAHMLRFEAALAAAQGEVNVIPAQAARTIVQVCRDSALPTWIDLRPAHVAGNPAIPLVKQLTEAVGAVNADAARWVHYGATSQDVIDTATMLSLQEIIDLHRALLHKLRNRLAALAEEHTHTRMLGRTLLQQASIITFGFKVVRWLQALDDAAAQLEEVHHRGLYVQLGGPVGTLSAFGDQGAAVTSRVAAELRLHAPLLAWHTNRTPIVRCATMLAALTTQLGKIAQDVVLAMQSEIGELSERRAAGKGGSSSMPHKHNPVQAISVLAAAKSAPHLLAGLLGAAVHEHERAAGGWHAEWLLLPQLCSVSHAALRASCELVSGLEVHADRMRENLERAGAAIFSGSLAEALLPHMSRTRAQALSAELCEEAMQSQTSLAEIAAHELPKQGVALSTHELTAIVSGDREARAAATLTQRYLQQRRSSEQHDGR